MKMSWTRTFNSDTMEKLKEYGSHYKIMCREVPWNDRVETTEKMTVDADSVIFDEIRRFTSSISSVDIREKLKVHVRNVFDRRELIRSYVCLLAEKCSRRIKSIEGEIVFGTQKVPDIKLGVNIERKERRRETFEHLSRNTSLTDMEAAQDTIKILGTHLLTLRDRIRNATAKNFPNATFSIEPDKYCARKYSLSFSYDYDLYLFGLQTMQREREGIVQSLNISSVLRWLGFENVKEYIIACLLQGTDYNRGIKGIGKVRAKKRVKEGLEFDDHRIPEFAKNEMANAYQFFTNEE